jgi:hypothetical protein
MVGRGAPYDNSVPALNTFSGLLIEFDEPIKKFAWWECLLPPEQSTNYYNVKILGAAV